MADWAKPTTGSRYDTEFIPEISGRLDDAVELFNVDGSNMPEHAMKFNRVSSKFQEWITGAWVDRPIAASGGVSGLGSIATQEANNVNITGGSITGINFSASNITSGTLDAARLATSGATPGTYGDGSNVPVVTVDNKGRITTITTTPAGAAGVPSGLIAIFDVSCPTGWTRVSTFDNYFLRGAATYGATGGASSHTHTVDPGAGGHTHTINNHQHYMDHAHPFTTGGPTGNIYSSGDGGGHVTEEGHTHSGNTQNSTRAWTDNPTDRGTDNQGSHIHTLQSQPHLPPYINVVFCKKN